MPQMNKWFGLKKLRKIAGRDERWFVSPYTVFQKPSQVRLKAPAQRVLIRTDEKGKRYSKLKHENMPRTEVSMPKVPLPKKAQNSLIRNRIRFQLQMMLSAKERKKTAIILHPTRPRSEIAATGNISILRGNIMISVFKNPSPGEKIHKYLTAIGEQIFPEEINGKWVIPQEKLVGRPEDEKKMLANVLDFINKAIEQRQIKLGTYKTWDISFVTWKNAPATLELFDLIEYRGKVNRSHQ